MSTTNCETWDKAFFSCKMTHWMSNKREREKEKVKRKQTSEGKITQKALRHRDGAEEKYEEYYLYLYFHVALPHATFPTFFFLRKMKYKRKKNTIYIFIRSSRWISLILIEFFSLEAKRCTVNVNFISYQINWMFHTKVTARMISLEIWFRVFTFESSDTTLFFPRLFSASSSSSF